MSKLIDLTNQKFGRLTVLKRVENKGKASRWLCKCDCGIEKVFYGSNLKRGLTTSCGCFRKEKLSELKLQNLVGEKFNGLLVIELDHYNPDTRQYYWKCLCDCGGTSIVYGGHLKDGHSQSCGCLTSLGEKKIAGLLSENNICFVKNKGLNLILPTGGKARYDFIIYENENIKYAIEYDGWQHVYKSTSKWDNQGAFETRQKSDCAKNEYCIQNNIPLIRIPHTQYSKLEIADLLLETTQFLIK